MTGQHDMQAEPSESSAVGDSEEQDYPPFMSPTGVRRMTIAVVVMGVILLVGFATLVGLIIYKSSKAKKTELARSAPAVISTDEARKIYGGDAGMAFVNQRVPKGARITNTAIDGDRIVLTIEDGAGASVMIIDTRGWKVLGVVRLSEDDAD